MKLGIVLVLLACVSVCCAQNKADSGTAAKKPQRSFAGDVPATIADSVAEWLKYIEDSFLGVAEAMPEDKYDYIPTAGKFDAPAASASLVLRLSTVRRLRIVLMLLDL